MTVDRPVLGGPAVVRIDQPGVPQAWVMTPTYAREMAALLIGAAVAVDQMNDLDGGS